MRRHSCPMLKSSFLFQNRQLGCCANTAVFYPRIELMLVHSKVLQIFFKTLQKCSTR